MGFVLRQTSSETLSLAPAGSSISDSTSFHKLTLEPGAHGFGSRNRYIEPQVFDRTQRDPSCEHHPGCQVDVCKAVHGFCSLCCFGTGSSPTSGHRPLTMPKKYQRTAKSCFRWTVDWSVIPPVHMLPLSIRSCFEAGPLATSTCHDESPCDSRPQALFKARLFSRQGCARSLPFQSFPSTVETSPAPGPRNHPELEAHNPKPPQSLALLLGAVCLLICSRVGEVHCSLEGWLLDFWNVACPANS